MPKQIYCSKCGAELTVSLKALPQAKRVITVVDPHTCEDGAKNPFNGLDKPVVLVEEEKKEPVKPSSTDANGLFDKLSQTVSKRNELTKPTTIFDKPSGDKRPKEDISQSFLKSTPPGISNAVKSMEPSDTDGLED